MPLLWPHGSTGLRKKNAHNSQSDRSHANDQGRPARTCILTGAVADPDILLRLVLGPEGHIAPDFAGKSSGRGAWVSLAHAPLEAALAKGKLAGALCRSFKTSPIVVPADLSARILSGLERRVLDHLGLAMKAGALVTGSDTVAALIQREAAELVLHAQDAADDGVRKLKGVETYTLPCPRETLSLALGRARVVHIAVRKGAMAGRLRIDIRRWLAYGSSVSGESLDGVSSDRLA